MGAGWGRVWGEGGRAQCFQRVGKGDELTKNGEGISGRSWGSELDSATKTLETEVDSHLEGRSVRTRRSLLLFGMFAIMLVEQVSRAYASRYVARWNAHRLIGVT